MYTLSQNVSNHKASQIVVEDIQKKILNGDLKAGDALPPEREMTENYKISRPLLRESLKALESMGLVAKKHGKGNFITNNINEALSKTAVLSFKLENGNPNDILDLRFIVESYTVPKAAHNATEADVEELKIIHQKMIDEAEPRLKAKLDRALHLKIAQISNNKLVLNILDEASVLLDMFTDETIRIAPFAGNSIENIYKEHAEIIEAIETHDSERAFSAIEKHLNHINISLMNNSI